MDDARVTSCILRRRLARRLRTRREDPLGKQRENPIRLHFEGNRHPRVVGIVTAGGALIGDGLQDAFDRSSPEASAAAALEALQETQVKLTRLGYEMIAILHQERIVGT